MIPLPRRPASLAVDIAVGVLLIYTTALDLREAAERPFWFDELFTVLLARLPTLGDVFGALADATDTSGPAFYVIERAAAAWHPHAELAYRIPSVLASNLTCALIYVIARRDVGSVPAFVGVFALLMSQLYHGYSLEARPYALMVLFITVAILGWQRAAHRVWTLVLAAAALLAVATHYYSVFALAVFAAAEVVYSARRRQLRVGVWLALGMGGVALLLAWPFLSSLRSYYGGAYWSHATLAKTLVSYDTLMSIGAPGGSFGVVVALGLGLMLLAVRLWPQEDDPETIRPTPEMLTLIVALLCVPLIVAITAYLMRGGFTDRYAIGVLPGIALAAAYLLYTVRPRTQAWVLVAAMCAFGSHELTFWAGGVEHGLRPRPRTAALTRFVAKAAGTNLPVVVGNGLEYLPMAFYGTGRPDVRLVAVTDVDAARRYAGTDSIDLDLIALRRHVDVRVEDFSTFAEHHPAFLLLAVSGPDNWWPRRLVDDGYELTVIGRTATFALYRAEAPVVAHETR